MLLDENRVRWMNERLSLRCNGDDSFWKVEALPPHLPRKYLERAVTSLSRVNIRVWRSRSLSFISSHPIPYCVWGNPRLSKPPTDRHITLSAQEFRMRWRGGNIITHVRVESREQRESRVRAGAGWVGISVSILHLQLRLRSEEWEGNWGGGGFEVTKGERGNDGGPNGHTDHPCVHAVPEFGSVAARAAGVAVCGRW